MPPLLEVKNISRSYGYRVVLQDISFSLAAGEILCFQGPNGAGKTTLLSALISRSAPDQGELFFQGRSLRNSGERGAYLSRLAYLGHEPGLFYDLSAGENLRFFNGLFFPRSDGEKKEEIRRMLAVCRLAERENDPVRSFSRGMKQRLALARIFLQEPDILLLDEPLTGLDRQGEQVLLELLKEHREKGRAALIVTHTEEPFRDITDRYVFLNRSRLIADIPREKYNASARSKVQDMLYAS